MPPPQKKEKKNLKFAFKRKHLELKGTAHYHQVMTTTDFLDFLWPSIVISYHPWQVLWMASGVYTELMNVFCWSDNTGVSMCESSMEIITYGCVFSFSVVCPYFFGGA